MTISVKILNDKIEEVSKTNTLLDMLLEFEKTLDKIDLYAFKNWMKGEVLEGPTVGRHYVNCYTPISKCLILKVLKDLWQEIA